MLTLNTRAPLLLILFIVSLVAMAAPVDAGSWQEESTVAGHTTLQLHQADDGLLIEWQLGAAADEVVAAALLDTMETVRYQGYDLPMQLQTILLPESAEPTLDFLYAASAPWSGIVDEGAPLIPPAIGWEEYGPLVEEKRLPSAPIFIMQQGRVRGQDVAVVAISPLYQTDSTAPVQLTQQIQALIPGARPLNGGLSELLTIQSAAANARTQQDVVALPRNVAADRSATKIYVFEPGIQRISGQSLLEAGVPPGTASAHLHLSYDGVEVALDVRDANGILDANDEIRFYAPAQRHSMKVGDYWNATDIYWLTVEEADGLRMATRSAQPGSAPLRATGSESGIWERNITYESRTAGVDGDHWFAKCMKDAETNPENACYSALTIEIESALPLAVTSDSTSIFTLTGSSLTIANHQLKVDVGGESHTLSWFNRLLYDSWQQGITTTVHGQQLSLSLLTGELPSGIMFDKVHWQQPVLLNFAGRGAAFSGVAGAWRYQLTNRPTESTLYDVTDPKRPQILTIPAGSHVQFQDQADTPHSYILAATGTIHAPTAVPHSPVTFDASNGADVLYIAPPEFHDELAPLIQLRETQGYKARVIDVYDIYDAWSFGHVSPAAIRNMLRNAVSSWTPAPIAFVLVGDGTADPLVYNQDGYENPNIIPPYLVDHVDPWLSQTACEVCYAQLDDDQPIGGPTDKGTLIDIWGGRLSVQNEEQLKAVVDKIVHYETTDASDPMALWRQTSVFIADDYYNSAGVPDLAGDFPGFSDEIIATWQSPNLISKRMYYDPDPQRRGGDVPWRIADANAARNNTVALLNEGPALFNTQGHSNHFFFASTVIGDPSVQENWLFSTLDVGKLNNFDRLTIVVEMTCYTAQFSHVSRTGTTLDENLQRHPNGGAVAIWGPAGLTVALGHDQMQQGFYRMLAEKPPLSARLGELVEAGYFKLFERGGCCQDARRTYLLLGDPLTTARVTDNGYTFLPAVQR